MNKYIFASANKNKILEISKELMNIKLLSLSDIGYFEEIVESGLTLKENALIKSQTIYDKYNIPTISDDTGLEVDALGGIPGVFSARYAGKEADANSNIRKLLKEMCGCKDRRARFRTIICLKNHKKEKFFEGLVEGCITNKAFGNNGFGYDPIFMPNGYKKTFAQLSLIEKNKISHRGKAINKLIEYLGG